MFCGAVNSIKHVIKRKTNWQTVLNYLRKSLGIGEERQFLALFAGRLLEALSYRGWNISVGPFLSVWFNALYN